MESTKSIEKTNIDIFKNYHTIVQEGLEQPQDDSI